MCGERNKQRGFYKDNRLVGSALINPHKNRKSTGTIGADARRRSESIFDIGLCDGQRKTTYVLRGSQLCWGGRRPLCLASTLCTRLPGERMDRRQRQVDTCLSGEAEVWYDVNEDWIEQADTTWRDFEREFMMRFGPTDFEEFHQIMGPEVTNVDIDDLAKGSRPGNCTQRSTLMSRS